MDATKIITVSLNEKNTNAIENICNSLYNINATL